MLEQGNKMCIVIYKLRRAKQKHLIKKTSCNTSHHYNKFKNWKILKAFATKFSPWTTATRRNSAA